MRITPYLGNVVSRLQGKLLRNSASLQFSFQRGCLIVTLFYIVVKKIRCSMGNVWKAKEDHKLAKKGNPVMFPLLLSPSFLEGIPGKDCVLQKLDLGSSSSKSLLCHPLLLVTK